VPTLTEIVDPKGVNFAPVQSSVDVLQLVRTVQLRVQPIIEQMLTEEFDRLVQGVLAEQWSEMAVRLKLEIDKCVHSTVIEVCNNTGSRSIDK
jgi:hypothetical protein